MVKCRVFLEVIKQAKVGNIEDAHLIFEACQGNSSLTNYVFSEFVNDEQSHLAVFRIMRHLNHDVLRKYILRDSSIISFFRACVFREQEWSQDLDAAFQYMRDCHETYISELLSLGEGLIRHLANIDPIIQREVLDYLYTRNHFVDVTAFDFLIHQVLHVERIQASSPRCQYRATKLLLGFMKRTDQLPYGRWSFARYNHYDVLWALWLISAHCAEAYTCLEMNKVDVKSRIIICHLVHGSMQNNHVISLLPLDVIRQLPDFLYKPVMDTVA